ncbi:MAG: hypothetical protein KBD78_13205, partial [Oligoflexales bacterium]|nr:hypothetical protein [Oligoflexales bacterium]
MRANKFFLLFVIKCLLAANFTSAKILIAQEAQLKSEIAQSQAKIDTIYIFETEEEFLSPGSANKISSQEIIKYRQTSIEDAIRFVPGVNVQTEDGYGLRPNIG